MQMYRVVSLYMAIKWSSIHLKIVSIRRWVFRRIKMADKEDLIRLWMSGLAIKIWLWTLKLVWKGSIVNGNLKRYLISLYWISAISRI